MRKVAKKVCKLSLFSQLSAPIKSGVINHILNICRVLYHTRYRAVANNEIELFRTKIETFFFYFLNSGSRKCCCPSWSRGRLQKTHTSETSKNASLRYVCALIKKHDDHRHRHHCHYHVSHLQTVVAPNVFCS